jgi:signal transduction histidine kinase
MWKRLSLRARIFLMLTALVLTALSGGLVTVWHTRAMDSLLTSLIDKNVASFQAAEELETALLQQKGFTTYYFLDGDPQWLEQLNHYQQNFQEWLSKARKSAYTEAMGEILHQIEAQYQRYVDSRARVIKLYQEGQREKGAQLHKEVRRQFMELYNLCERYKLIHEYTISRARVESQARARFLNTLALVVMPGVAVLGVLLAYILIKQILEPIRKLALETASAPRHAPPTDEVTALSQQVYSLIEDVDQAQSQLSRSQEHLLQSEKWAMVGKLAAGVAHSIRNPLTSVNMRLFSMKRTLRLTASEKEDIEVISEEIRHIDTIVRNFLEFSRPPKLRMQRLSPSDVVDLALQLLSQRLEGYNVAVQLLRDQRLPAVWADPDQLKEVLVNLMVNACEAMVGGGTITIKEEEVIDKSLGHVTVIRVSDTGPGIPQPIQEKIFQPFFSTKEEGTGLGLSIAQRIIADHGGRLELASQENTGATFSITLPLKEDQAWAPS